MKAQEETKRDKNQKEEMGLLFSSDTNVFVQSSKGPVGKSLALLREFPMKLNSGEQGMEKRLFLGKGRTLEGNFPKVGLLGLTYFKIIHELINKD